MRTTTDHPAGRRIVDDQRNEVFHRLLREAAEQRDRRRRVHESEEAEAAEREFGDFLAVARGRARTLGQVPSPRVRNGS